MCDIDIDKEIDSPSLIQMMMIVQMMMISPSLMQMMQMMMFACFGRMHSYTMKRPFFFLFNTRTVVAFFPVICTILYRMMYKCTITTITVVTSPS